MREVAPVFVPDVKASVMSFSFTFEPVPLFG
jgi:hypothetical protein